MAEKLPAPPRNWILVHDQLPEVVIERHRAGAMHPEVHAAFARKVREKAETDGLLYRDTYSGYESRFLKPPKAA